MGLYKAKRLVLQSEIEDQGPAGFIGTTIEFDLMCFSDGDGLQVGISRSRSFSLVFSTCHISRCVNNDIDRYFRIFIEFICKSRSTTYSPT